MNSFIFNFELLALVNFWDKVVYFFDNFWKIITNISENISTYYDYILSALQVRDAIDLFTFIPSFISGMFIFVIAVSMMKAFLSKGGFHE